MRLTTRVIQQTLPGVEAMVTRRKGREMVAPDSAADGVPDGSSERRILLRPGRNAAVIMFACRAHRLQNSLWGVLHQPLDQPPTMAFYLVWRAHRTTVRSLPA
jgi:hypothetical protein